jgi:hypothetical protein
MAALLDPATRPFPPATQRASLKIGILTFHRCINYGSYWQARCLVEGLRARGLDAVLLDHDDAQVNRAEWRCAFQPLLPERTPRSDFPAYRQKARAVLQEASALPLSRRFPLHQPEEMEEYDLVLIGSDEVWNMRHPWYGGKAAFYGHGLKAKRIASYAASFGNQESGLEGWWAELLRGLSAISVRDDNSARIVREATGIDPALVLDPCLQFPPQVRPAESEQGSYVAVYGHSFPGWYRERVCGWARQRGYRLVSIGYRNDWADEQRIEAGPVAFAELVAGAEAVATNFFHGCVFALVNGRPFACASSPYRSNKIRGLMQKLGAVAHLTSQEDDADRIGTLLTQPLDPAIDQHLGALRIQSNQYLAYVLG